MNGRSHIAAGPLAGRIYMDDSATMTVWDLRTKARLLKSQFDIGLVVVDYLQLMDVGGRRDRQEISLISRSGSAKELNIPVIACSQLSRQVETREVA
jgi:replicative DNA helicase